MQKKIPTKPVLSEIISQKTIAKLRIISAVLNVDIQPMQIKCSKKYPKAETRPARAETKRQKLQQYKNTEAKK
ncbi:hypothetical protein [Succinivibrio dextrinosolvens]|jgi:hypothetical protein|uniref:hypothetical protein n=1 Tax=Succinivibrio dextrinosolvens TaxID=83771 RepID=UPI00241FEC1B|nr:hypothetical protein [Succinivibrio dextrinosolvens]MBE6423022.1 hypothetical protein [Succinivibrio dextrinosolvens]